MLRIHDEPNMKIVDHLLDLDDNAIPTSTAMYAILQEHYKWRWADKEKRLALWEDGRGLYVRDLELRQDMLLA